MKINGAVFLRPDEYEYMEEVYGEVFKCGE